MYANTPSVSALEGSRRSLPRVAFQGIAGAFSEQAIHRFWPQGATAVPSETFSLALQRVVDGTAHFAVIPVENVIAGPVDAALTALQGVTALRQCGELRLEIHLCVIGIPGASLAAVRVVHSHPMAIAQSARFFAQHPWLRPTVHQDTAGAARDVARDGDASVAAIASEAAADIYRLSVLARGVQDVPDNWTRFVVMCANGE